MPELRPYQTEALELLLPVPNVGIFDEMGVGKTVTAIAIDIERRKKAKGPTLVITLAGAMVEHWHRHFATWAPHLKVFTLDPKNREKTWKDFVDGNGDVFIMHWDALRLMPQLAQKQWLHIIADEVHKIMHRQTAMSKALKKIKADFKTGLSGTPTTGRPDLMWSILNWLYPKKYTAFWKFFERYVSYSIVYPQGYKQIDGPKNEKELQADLATFTIRRLKEDTLKLLPKVPQTYYVTLGPKQREAYEQMKEDMVAWVDANKGEGDYMEPIIAQAAIARLTRLLQFACAYAYWDQEAERVRMSDPSSKLDLCMALLEEAIEENNQVVVFSNFKQLIYMLNARLEAAKIPYSTIHGDIKQDDRAEELRAFRAGETKVFSGTISAGGVGIELQTANTVIFLDRNWSPALNKQAEDRLHRSGQDDFVYVIDIVAEDTIETTKLEQVERKWSWVQKLLGDI